MAQKVFNYLFALASLLLLFASQSPSAEARKFIGVNPWCRTAFHRRLCTRMVNGAVTQNEATINAMKATLEYAKRLQGMVELVKPAIVDLDPEAQASIMSRCTDSFERHIDDLETSIAAVQVNDIGSTRSHLSASLENGCMVALADYRIQSPLDIYVKLFHKQVDNCLAVLTQT